MQQKYKKQNYVEPKKPLKQRLEQNLVAVYLLTKIVTYIR